MTLFNELQNQMIRHRFRPNKRLAQHFIVNEALVQKLVGLTELKHSDLVLEIGPGTGFLTRELLKKSRVFAVEIDERLCSLLGQELGEKGLELACGDFLKAELPEFNKVVSLPPYFKSGQIMHRLLEHGFDSAVLVFQREFAEKLVAEPGFKEYCALSVLTGYGFEAGIVGKIQPGSFFPRPKGESSIVLLKASQRFGSVSDKAAFSFFVRTVFRFKNKNLKNALEKSRLFLLPRLGVNARAFAKKASAVQKLDEKVNLLSVRDFVNAFNKLSA